MGSSYRCTWEVTGCQYLAVESPSEANTFINKPYNATWCWEGKPYRAVDCHFDFVDTEGASAFFTWVGLTAILAVVVVSCLHLVYTYVAEGGFTLSSGRYLRYTWELEVRQLV